MHSYDSRKVFVKNFENKAALERLFGAYGIDQISIVEGKNYGFVTLKNEASVNEAIRKLNGTRDGAFGGTTLLVDRARTKPKT